VTADDGEQVSFVDKNREGQMELTTSIVEAQATLRENYGGQAEFYMPIDPLCRSPCRYC
jgi:hypothetical protein